MSSSKYSYCTDVKTEQITFKWVMKNFSLHLEDKGTPIISPDFHSENKKEIWQLRFYPQGSKRSAKDFTSIHLHLLSGILPIEVRYELSIIHSGAVMKTCQSIKKYESLTGYGWPNFVPRSCLLTGATDTITIFCKIDRLAGKIVTSLLNQSTAIPQQIHVNKEADRWTETFADLLENSKFSDITIIVENEKFPAHKLVLAGRSPVFAAMFQNKLKENRTHVIEIKRMKPLVVKGMLEFIYTNKVSNFEEISSDLLSAANKFDLVLLKSLCEESLAKTLSNENAVEMLILADLYRSENLKEHSMQFMYNHLADVVKSKGYQEMDQYPRLLKEFVSFMALRGKFSAKRRRVQS